MQPGGCKLSLKNGENNPDKILLGDPEPVAEAEEIITVYIKEHKFMVTPTEALSIMNQISGVLLAYGYSRGREQGQKKYNNSIRIEEGKNICTES
jgi:hypothetical protein